MSIVKGKADRFQGQSNPAIGAANPKAKLVDDKAVRNPPPPLAYQGLQVGDRLAVEYEPATATPIDNANQLLRSLSPFVFRVEPPFVFANDPAFIDDSNDKGLGTYSAGLRNARGFENARGAIGRSYAFGNSGNSTSADQFISKAQSPAATQGNDGTNLATVAGTAPDSLGAPAIADLYTAVDIAMQLQAALQTPPLVLLINPTSMKMAFTKIQQFQDRTRQGYVYQAWGEEQPKLSISARCGAFSSGGRGVQMASKRDSAAWQNLMTALMFYRNNGYIYDTIGKSHAHHFVGVLSIHYDGWIYYGNMESFSYTYDEQNQQGGMVFDMEFTVSSMVDGSQTNRVVTPMRAPTPSLSDFLISRKRDPGADTLSAGPGGIVGEGPKPQVWTSTTREKAGVSQGPAPAPKRGTAGFFQPATAEDVEPLGVFVPEPFRIS